jgi:hypothetical protein
VFVIGTVEMKSNVTLHIAVEGKLLGSADGKHNCDVQAQDDACALFGSCKFVTVTNSTFSTRWSVSGSAAAIRETSPYFEVGTPPAYGLFARNVRGLTLG